MAASHGKSKPRPIKIVRPDGSSGPGESGKPRRATTGEELARAAAAALGIPVRVAADGG